MNDIESRRITLSGTAIKTVCEMTGLDPDCKSHTLEDVWKVKKSSSNDNLSVDKNVTA